MSWRRPRRRSSSSRFRPLLPPEGIVASRVRDVVARVRSTPTDRIDVAGVRGSAGAALAAAIARAGPPRGLRRRRSRSRPPRRRGRGVLRPRSGGRRRRGHRRGRRARLRRERVVSVRRREPRPARRDEPHGDALPPRARAAVARAASCRRARSRARSFRARELARRDRPDRGRVRRSIATRSFARCRRPGTCASRRRGPGELRGPRRAPRRLAALDRLAGAGGALRRPRALDEAVRPRRADDAQGRAATSRQLWLPPVREAILDAAHRRAGARARDPARRGDRLADDQDARAGRRRDVHGRAFFGAEGFLPAYYDDLDPLLAYVPRDAVVVLDDPPASRARVRDELERATRDAAAEGGRRRRSCPRRSTRTRTRSRRELAARAVVALHRTAVAGEAEARASSAFESAREPLDLASRDHDDLTRAVKAARASKGKNATLAPLVRRIAHWREHGLRVFVTARAQTQAERLVTLLRHQGVECKARLGAFDPAWLDEPGSRGRRSSSVRSRAASCSRPTGSSSSPRRRSSARAPTAAASARSAADPSRPFLEDLRSLSPGRLRRARRARHRPLPGARPQGTSAGLTVDLIAIEYARRRQALPAGLAPQPAREVRRAARTPRPSSTARRLHLRAHQGARRRARSARWPTSSCASTPSGRRCPATPLPPADDDYRAFEATFPFDETADQARAIDDVNRDLEAAAPDGPPRLRRRRLRQDRGRAARGVPRGDGGQAGRAPLPDDGARAAALPHVRGAHGRLPHRRPRRSRASRRKKEQDETLIGLKDGKVDVVVGTHRLLSKDVHFKDLGLLVVDEEQRFGVAHKERIKQLRAQVDVLTLTATPIPRTLQMAVTGLRDLSLITTAAGRPPRRAHDRHALGRPGRARGGDSASSRAAGSASTSTTASTGSTRRRSASRSSSPPRASPSPTGR